MSVCDEWICKATKDLPEVCSTDDLVKAGLYSSLHTAYMARTRGACPPYIKLGRKFIYPKEGVIGWLKGNIHENHDQTTQKV